MRVFLIDSENVGWWALDGASKLDENDMIYILVGTQNSNSENVKSPIIIEALRSKAKYIIEETGHIGKNYLDFQLSLMIGEIISKYEDAQIIILSKDQGYKAVLDYLKKHNRKGYQAASIKEFLNPVKEVVKLENNVIDVEVKVKQKKKKKSKSQKMVVETEDDLKKYQEELVNIIADVFPDKKKATLILQANAASKKTTKKELKVYCQSNLKDKDLKAYCKMCQIFPY